MASTVNNFTIAVGTVNGTGSASSNAVLAKSLFRMGVPVAAKNLFPSNIAGLPTWFLIRLTEEGYQCRSENREVVVAMNPSTLVEDIASVAPGGVLLLDESVRKKEDIERDDITCFAVPFVEISREHAPDVRLRKLLANMVYVGVVSHLLDLDKDTVMEAIADQFSKKEKVVSLNQKVVQAGMDYAAEHLDRSTVPFKVEVREQSEKKLFIEGNTSMAMGALMGGCTVVAWYPITPSSGFCEEFIRLATEYRTDGEEKRFADVQAEDELASLGLVLGAGWAGARAMTATAGPGIALMGEFAGFGYYAEIPAVIFDVQRVGPSTGMPTRTQQSDVQLCAHLSHGDTEHVLLLPSGPEELYEFGQLAFDLAERLQTPIFVLTDLDMGMNSWMCKPLEYPEKGFDRGKVLDMEGLKKMESFNRYKDVDDDGIPYRTLPGTPHPLAPYFTRGSGHTTAAEYTEDPVEYQEVVDRIKKKIEGSVQWTPAPVEGGDAKADLGILHFGSTSFAVEEAMNLLSAEGIETRDLRIRAFPLHDEVVEFVQSCKVVFVAEQNRDGQLADLVRLKVPGSAGKIKKVLYYGGLPMAAGPIVEGVKANLEEPVRA